jgi:hypothetical protein
MKYLILVLFALIVATQEICAQAKERKLSTSINHPSLNLFAPFISTDANAMVFLSDNTEDNILAPFYTVREATDWREPQPLPKNIHSRLNFLKGYALSPDGKRVYFTTIKGPGVGGYDIWYTDAKGTGWSEPVNLGLPINTKGQEACPSISADGNVMYFMRCEKMDQNTAQNCKIFRVAKKPNGQWDEPTALPDNINTGNSQTPRIMADAETLIFSSDKMSPNKGGMDLYVTRFESNQWTNPRPLDFINSDKEDQYVSVAALGRYLLKDASGQKRNELVEYLIPNDLRPRGMMKVEGKITDPSGQPVSSYIAAFDLQTGKRFYSGRPAADGTFFLYLKEGTRYELSIDPEQNNLTYFSKTFDLTTDKIPQLEKVTAVLKPLSTGDEISLDAVAFKPATSILEASTVGELKKLARIMNANSTATFEMQVLLNGYVEDSIQSDPDLTEIVYDTVVYESHVTDSTGQDIIDDSIAVEPTYHNNRTLKQAEAIIEYLVQQGVSRDRVKAFGNAIQATLPENKKLTIKAVVKTI